uniref:Uncharacterized protein n=1 Tax=viral metagenome TaxID=1070528 RepID=A0A6C0LST1_9ZZZZ
MFLQEYHSDQRDDYESYESYAPTELNITLTPDAAPLHNEPAMDMSDGDDKEYKIIKCGDKEYKMHDLSAINIDITDIPDDDKPMNSKCAIYSFGYTRANAMKPLRAIIAAMDNIKTPNDVFTECEKIPNTLSKNSKNSATVLIMETKDGVKLCLLRSRNIYVWKPGDTPDNLDTWRKIKLPKLPHMSPAETKQRLNDAISNINERLPVGFSAHLNMNGDINALFAMGYYVKVGNIKYKSSSTVQNIISSGNLNIGLMSTLMNCNVLEVVPLTMINGPIGVNQISKEDHETNVNEYMAQTTNHLDLDTTFNEYNIHKVLFREPGVNKKSTTEVSANYYTNTYLSLKYTLQDTPQYVIVKLGPNLGDTFRESKRNTAINPKMDHASKFMSVDLKPEKLQNSFNVFVNENSYETLDDAVNAFVLQYSPYCKQLTYQQLRALLGINPDTTSDEKHGIYSKMHKNHNTYPGITPDTASNMTRQQMIQQHLRISNTHEDKKLEHDKIPDEVATSDKKICKDIWEETIRRYYPTNYTPFQLRCIAFGVFVNRVFKHGIALCLPTGAGKTAVMKATLYECSVYSNKPVLLIFKDTEYMAKMNEDRDAMKDSIPYYDFSEKYNSYRNGNPLEPCVFVTSSAYISRNITSEPDINFIRENFAAFALDESRNTSGLMNTTNISETLFKIRQSMPYSSMNAEPSSLTALESDVKTVTGLDVKNPKTMRLIQSGIMVTSNKLSGYPEMITSPSKFDENDHFFHRAIAPTLEKLISSESFISKSKNAMTIIEASSNNKRERKYCPVIYLHGKTSQQKVQKMCKDRGFNILILNGIGDTISKKSKEIDPSIHDAVIIGLQACVGIDGMQKTCRYLIDLEVSSSYIRIQRFGRFSRTNAAYAQFFYASAIRHHTYPMLKSRIDEYELSDILQHRPNIKMKDRYQLYMDIYRYNCSHISSDWLDKYVEMNGKPKTYEEFVSDDMSSLTKMSDLLTKQTDKSSDNANGYARCEWEKNVTQAIARYLSTLYKIPYDSISQERGFYTELGIYRRYDMSFVINGVHYVVEVKKLNHNKISSVPTQLMDARDSLGLSSGKPVIPIAIFFEDKNTTENDCIKLCGSYCKVANKLFDDIHQVYMVTGDFITNSDIAKELHLSGEDIATICKEDETENDISGSDIVQFNITNIIERKVGSNESSQMDVIMKDVTMDSSLFADISHDSTDHMCKRRRIV